MIDDPDKGTTLLKRFHIRKVDLVDRGADPLATIELAKRSPDAPEIPAPVPHGGDPVAKADQGVIRRIVSAVGKGLGWSEAEVAKHVEEATTFSAELAEEELVPPEVSEEVWTYFWALQDAVYATMRDPEADRASMIQQSLSEFTQAVEAALPEWLEGRTVLAKSEKKPELTPEGLQRIAKALSVRIGEPTATPVAKHDPDPASSGKEATVAEFDVTTLPDEAQAAFAELEKRATDAEAKVAAAPPAAAPEDEGDDIAKALADPTVSDVVKRAISLAQTRQTEAETQAREASEIAKAERDTRLTAEFIAKAASDYGSLPGISSDELGPVLKALAEKAPEELAKLEPVLKAASGAIESGSLFAELGAAGGSTAGSAYQRAEAIAKALREADPALTQEAAIAKAFEDDPKLYDAHKAESRQSA